MSRFLSETIRLKVVQIKVPLKQVYFHFRVGGLNLYIQLLYFEAFESLYNVHFSIARGDSLKRADIQFFVFGKQIVPKVGLMYLEMILDHKLTFKTHAKRIVENSDKTLMPVLKILINLKAVCNSSLGNYTWQQKA